MSTRLPAARAALRIARRDAWRNKGRSALIALMVALPVLAASTVSVIYRSDQHDPRDSVQLALGAQAQASLTIGSGQPLAQTPDGVNVASVSTETSPSQPKAPTHQEFVTRVRAVISSRDRVLTDDQLYTSRVIRFHDRVLESTVREFDYTAAGAGGLVKQAAGRAPAGSGEVAVSQDLARKEGIRVGDQLSVTVTRQATPKSVTVVGIVAGTALIGNPSVIALPGDLIPAELFDPNGAGASVASNRNLLVVGPDPVTWDQVLDLNQVGSAVISRSVFEHPPTADRVPYSQQHYDSGSSVQAGAVGIGVVVIGLVLLQIALLAGPAIAVGARRNQRSLALMASAGAERRHLRAVVLATSAVIGLVSCLVAAGLGAGLGAAIVLVLRQYFDQQIVRVDLRPLDLIGLALVGGLTAVAAALIPARQAARLDVVAALTGRRGQLPPRLRVPVAGLLVSVAGVGLAFAGSQAGHPFAATAGLALTEIGLVAAAGAIVALAARLAVRLPFSPRFALRDAARQRARTAPAVAAVLAAIAGGTTALVYISAQGLHDRQTYTPSAQLGVVTMQGSNGVAPADLSAAEAAIRRTLPIAAVAPLRGVSNAAGDPWISLSLTPPPSNACPLATAVEITVRLATLARSDPRCANAPQGPGTIGFSSTAFFDDGAAFALLTGVRDPAGSADIAALRAGRVLVFDPLLLWPDGTVHVEVHREPGSSAGTVSDHLAVLPAVVSTAGPRLSLPVYPLSAAGPLGLKPAPQGLIASTTRMPTSAEEERASAAVHDIADVYVNVERGYHDDYSLGLLALVVAAAVVTLGGTFTAVGLAAAEGRADIATLAAVGASPGVRRRLAASQAGVIAGLGAVLGVGSGVLAGWILIRMQVDHTVGVSYGDFESFGAGAAARTGGWQLVLPWRYLLATGLGVPALAVAIGFLTTRSRLPMVRRLGQ